ncbi:MULTISPECIES: acyl-CoA thioesterase [unclassified Campylobacter]|uniref:acyl-CoA thioesterase n=1 Tax=unclassified Campylobacter TaxID=2593542 RepID=UPI0014522E43|nr:thioesterase family protein [Campylobacter sp. RM16192]QCD52720.1 acyl-CoA thioesterase [Campylobacter sp. RM16192]
MQISKTTIIKAQFFDVDSMNVVWHGNYVKYLETARCELLDEIGYNYENMKKDGFAFPIVKLDIKYVRPVFFADEIEVEARLVDFESFLKISYLIKNHKTKEKISVANTSQIAIDMINKETCTIMPDSFKEAVEKYLKRSSE